MDAAAIIETFATTGRRLPVEAMQACRDDWESVAPALLGVLERYLEDGDRSERTEAALFFILHMFGERREARAFAPLCRLAADPEALEAIIEDAVTESW